MAYIREVFLPQTLEDAKHIALTNDPADPHKFQEETEFLMRLLQSQSLISKTTRALDFGCGMGRVSKMLIDTFGCVVQGVDQSESMRYFSHQYVAHKNFSVRPDIDGVFDFILAIFVLQHVEYPDKEIAYIYKHMSSDGTLLVVNEKRRFVPVGVDEQKYVVWKDDHVDIDGLLSTYFKLVRVCPYHKGKDILCALWQKQDLGLFWLS